MEQYSYLLYSNIKNLHVHAYICQHADLPRTFPGFGGACSEARISMMMYWHCPDGEEGRDTVHVME